MPSNTPRKASRKVFPPLALGAVLRQGPYEHNRDDGGEAGDDQGTIPASPDRRRTRRAERWPRACRYWQDFICRLAIPANRKGAKRLAKITRGAMRKVEQPSPMRARAAMSAEAEGASANRIVAMIVSAAVTSMVFFGP